jgi:hypothetical protein
MRTILVIGAAAAIGGAMHVAAQTRAASPLANLKTIPERTNYEQTSRYADVIAFMEAVEQAAPKVVHLTTLDTPTKAARCRSPSSARRMARRMP